MKQAEMSLQFLGWNSFFDDHFNRLSGDKGFPMRIARQDKFRYLVLGVDGEKTAILTGNLRSDTLPASERPAIGDWVVVENGGNNESLVINGILPRQSQFVRKTAGQTTSEQVVAANIDTLFVVTGLDHDYNLRRIERYVTQSWNSGAVPVVLLNKADVCQTVEIPLNEVMAVAAGIDVHAISATEGIGLDVLNTYLGPGKTVAFVGSSGVGKSTIINRLLGDEHFVTMPVREDDSRGRHATTYRELLPVPGGGVVIDTPGMRELQLWGTQENLQGAFADIEDLGDACRFRDCSHTCEPGCAVLLAIDNGSLDPGRYNSYQKLKKELAYLERRQDETPAYLSRQKERQLGKLYKQILKEKKKRKSLE